MENMMSNSMSRQYISSEVRFYTITELAEMLGWGEMTVQKMFNDPSFPAVDFGKQKVVEAHALINYFSTRRSKETDRHWRKKGKANVKQRT
jgi:hypothetical protein